MSLIPYKPKFSEPHFFEPYLDVLERSLGFLSQAERGEWREEARQHLLEIAHAEAECGLAPDEVIAAAMRKFGDAAQIGQEMAQSVAGNPLTNRTAVALFTRPLIVAMLLLIGLAYVYVLTDSPLCLSLLQFGGATAFVTVPILGGWSVGKCFRPGQSALRLALALLLISILSLPIAGVLLVPMRGISVDGAAVDFRWGLIWFPLTGFALLLSRHETARRILASR